VTAQSAPREIAQPDDRIERKEQGRPL
jgi:hypothetical protein